MRQSSTKRLPPDLRPRGCTIQLPGILTGSFFEEIGGGRDRERPYDLPTRTVDLPGTNLNYFELGEGNPVIFAHGALGDYRMWGYQFESFAARYRVISYSMRFHYPNAPPSDGLPYSVGLHARDLAGLIQKLELGPAHLVGQSSGAMVAALCARDNPKLVRSLSLCEPSQFPWLQDIAGGQEAMDAFLESTVRPGARLLEQKRFGEAVAWYCDGVLGKGAFGKLPPVMQQVMRDNVTALVADLNSPETFSPFTFEDARALRVPTLLIRGGATLPLFDMLTDKFAALVPRVEVAGDPTAPHAVHFTSPERFNAMVLDFIDRHAV